MKVFQLSIMIGAADVLGGGGLFDVHFRWKGNDELDWPDNVLIRLRNPREPTRPNQWQFQECKLPQELPHLEVLCKHLLQRWSALYNASRKVLKPQSGDKWQKHLVRVTWPVHRVEGETGTHYIVPFHWEDDHFATIGCMDCQHNLEGWNYAFYDRYPEVPSWALVAIKSVWVRMQRASKINIFIGDNGQELPHKRTDRPLPFGQEIIPISDECAWARRIMNKPRQFLDNDEIAFADEHQQHCPDCQEWIQRENRREDLDPDGPPDHPNLGGYRLL